MLADVDDDTEVVLTEDELLVEELEVVTVAAALELDADVEDVVEITVGAAVEDVGAAVLETGIADDVDVLGVTGVVESPQADP